MATHRSNVILLLFKEKERAKEREKKTQEVDKAPPFKRKHFSFKLLKENILSIALV